MYGLDCCSFFAEFCRIFSFCLRALHSGARKVVVNFAFVLVLDFFVLLVVSAVFCCSVEAVFFTFDDSCVDMRAIIQGLPLLPPLVRAPIPSSFLPLQFAGHPFSLFPLYCHCLLAET